MSKVIKLSEYQIQVIIAEKYGVNPCDVIFESEVYTPSTIRFGGQYESSLTVKILQEE